MNLGRLLPVLAFTVAYLLAATGFAFTSGNIEFVFYIGVMLVLMAVVWLVHRGIDLTAGMLWALSVWGLAHMLGGLWEVPAGWPVNGDSRVLYNLWVIPNRLKYDHVVHAYGFGVATWVCWHGIAAAIRSRGGHAQPTPGLLLLAVCAGVGLGALNEVIEFVAVLLIPDTNVGGYLNTGWDLVANLAGALIAAVLIRWRGTAAPAGGHRP